MISLTGSIPNSVQRQLIRCWSILGCWLRFSKSMDATYLEKGSLYFAFVTWWSTLSSPLSVPNPIYNAAGTWCRNGKFVSLPPIGFQYPNPLQKPSWLAPSSGVGDVLQVWLASPTLGYLDLVSLSGLSGGTICFKKIAEQLMSGSITPRVADVDWVKCSTFVNFLEGVYHALIDTNLCSGVLPVLFAADGTLSFLPLEFLQQRNWHEGVWEEEAASAAFRKARPYLYFFGGCVCVISKHWGITSKRQLQRISAAWIAFFNSRPHCCIGFPLWSSFGDAALAQYFLQGALEPCLVWPAARPRPWPASKDGCTPRLPLGDEFCPLCLWEGWWFWRLCAVLLQPLWWPSTSSGSSVGGRRGMDSELSKSGTKREAFVRTAGDEWG